MLRATLVNGSLWQQNFLTFKTWPERFTPDWGAKTDRKIVPWTDKEQKKKTLVTYGSKKAKSDWTIG